MSKNKKLIYDFCNYIKQTRMRGAKKFMSRKKKYSAMREPGIEKMYIYFFFSYFFPITPLHNPTAYQ